MSFPKLSRGGLQSQIRCMRTRAWESKNGMSPADQFEHFREGLAHQLQLQNKFSTLRQEIKANQDGSGRIEAFLDDLEHHVKGLEDFFSGITDPLLYNEHKTWSQRDTGTAAHAVFDIPELFDMILQHLSVHDIFSFQQTSLQANAMINRSPRLQSLLCLRPDPPDAPFRQPRLDSYEISSFYRDRRRFRRTGSESEDLAIKISYRREKPRIGQNYRNLLIAQPPIYDMDVSTSCCGHRNHLDNSTTKVHSDVGFRIGDLLDLAEEKHNQHQMCPFASPHLHDEEGYVRPDVVCVGHPPRPSSQSDAVGDASTWSSRGPAVPGALHNHVPSEMEVYSQYKRQAHANGQRIETLTEWRASQAA